MGAMTGLYVVIQGICLVVSAIGCSFVVLSHTLEKTSRKKGKRHVG